VGQIIRAAFVGAGAHSTSTLYPQLHKIADFDLAAVCDLDRAKAQQNARWFGARQVYTDLTEMLATEPLDAAFVVGDPHMMYEVGIQVLEAGLPIFVEKPPAVDVPKARHLAQVAEEQGLWGMVAYMKRFAPAYVQVREMIHEPKFGGLQMLEVSFCQGPYPTLWGIEDTTLAFLTGQLCHIFDLVRYLGGEVEWVEAHRRRLNPERQGIFVTLAFSDGGLGAMNLNTLWGWEQEPWHDIHESLRVIGVGETVEVRDGLYLTHSRFGDSWLGPGETGYGRAHEIVRPGWPNLKYDLLGYGGELAHFIECLRAGHPPEQGADLRDGAKSLELTEAIYQSLLNDGQRAALPVR